MANRKLQGEIDRCLKKVTEGIDEFSELYDKIYATTNQSQKEKLEAELKREIKKLQRLRDQIKTWISSSDIKDKRSLMDARKTIETQMEKFKACEREMKTKQYSKEGLQAKEKLDPAEVARNEAGQWISGQVDRLSTQVDALEAESEQITLAKGKKMSKSDSTRLKEIEKGLERHKYHMAQLETMLRMLENDQLSVEDVESVKDSIEYYVDSNQEPDFDEDMEMYDHLNLIEDENIGYLEEHHGLPSSDSNEKLPEEEKKSSKEPSPTTATISDPSLPSSNSTAANTSSTLTSPTKKPTSSKSSPPVALPPPSKVKSPPNPVKSAPQIPAASAVMAPIVSTQSLTPVAAASKVPPPAPVQKYSVAAAAKEKIVSSPKPQEASIPQHDQSSKPETSFSRIVQSNLVQPLAQGQQQPSNSVSNPFMLPSCFNDLVSSFEYSKKKTNGRGDEVLRNQYLMAILESSYQQCPDIIDAERPLPFQPTNPSRTSPPYYPKQPMLSLTSPAIFERFDLDTLFFLFYYRQNTREQLLAARELKRQSWRFHKKYLTWFQRHEEPKTITDDYEQGTYIYFDYEGAWCQRKKTEFTFEYRFLEGE